MTRFSKLRPVFLIASLVGLVSVNLPFLYFALIDKAVYRQAMSNGMALAFMGEAFLLTILFAFLIARLGWKSPGWIVFILLSLVGSLAFSVPFYLYLHSKPSGDE